jgi:hypothetical protein
MDRVFAASRLKGVAPLRYVRLAAAALFFLFGVGALAGTAGLF